MEPSSRQKPTTLVSLFINYLAAQRSVMPLDTGAAQGQLADDQLETRRIDVQTSHAQAMAAGAREAGITVGERPKVVSVRANGPAHQILFPGDIIRAIDDTEMGTENDVRLYMRNNKQVGGQAVVSLVRDGQEIIVTVSKLISLPTDGTVASMGITVGTGYVFSPQVQFHQVVDDGDSAQSLALALTTSALLADHDFLRGRTIGAAGRVSPTGEVTRIPGINEHIESALLAHVSLLFIPLDNCPDISSPDPAVTIVPITTLHQGIDILDRLGDDPSILPTC
jgi:PDZ domain-containing protein